MEIGLFGLLTFVGRDPAWCEACEKGRLGRILSELQQIKHLSLTFCTAQAHAVFGGVGGSFPLGVRRHDDCCFGLSLVVDD